MWTKIPQGFLHKVITPGLRRARRLATSGLVRPRTFRHGLQILSTRFADSGSEIAQAVPHDLEGMNDFLLLQKEPSKVDFYPWWLFPIMFTTWDDHHSLRGMLHADDSHNSDMYRKWSKNIQHPAYPYMISMEWWIHCFNAIEAWYDEQFKCDLFWNIMGGSWVLRIVSTHRAIAHCKIVKCTSNFRNQIVNMCQPL